MIKFIESKPLKPSIKLAPFITNKKHNNKMLNEIIHKYNIYTKNKKCLNPYEITFKLYDIFNK